MNTSGVSNFDQARIEWAIRLRYSPMPKLDPEMMARQLNAFRIGELQTVGKTWEIMMERSGELAVNADKRYSELAGLQTQTVSDGSPDGDRHAIALEYFYRNLRVTHALDQDKVGGVSQLLYDMASAHSYYYSAHELLLRVDNAAAREVTAEFRHTPIWFFESRRGYLGYLRHIFDMYGQPCLAGEWLTCVGLGWMRPLSMAFCTEMFTLRDWQIWCLRYASGFLEGIVDETPGSEGWENAVQTVQTLANDGAVVHSPKVVLKFLEQASRTGMPFSELIQLVHGLYAKCYRGVDLATGSRAASTQGGQNPVGASIQSAESGIFLVRDAAWATGYLNERVDRPLIRYLFGQESRAFTVVQPPLDDISDDDLKFLQTAVPMGLRIAMKDVYKKFKWSAPGKDDACLQPPAAGQSGSGSLPPADPNSDDVEQPTAPAATEDPNAGKNIPTAADPIQPDTQPAQVEADAPIGAGADPKALAQIASPNMPSPQVQAGSLWSQAGAAITRARRKLGGLGPSTDASGPNPGPAFGYALPNEVKTAAGGPPASSEKFSQAAELKIAAGVHADLGPAARHVAELLGAINQISDENLRRQKAAALLAQWPGITSDALLAPATLEPILDTVATAYAAGLQPPDVKPAAAPRAKQSQPGQPPPVPTPEIKVAASASKKGNAT